MKAMNMNDYRVVWCDEGQVRCVDGLTLFTANKAFAAICRELRKSIAWVHILRMPERTTIASMDRAAIEFADRAAGIVSAWRKSAPQNTGGEMNPEDQA